MFLAFFSHTRRLLKALKIWEIRLPQKRRRRRSFSGQWIDLRSNIVSWENLFFPSKQRNHGAFSFTSRDDEPSSIVCPLTPSSSFRVEKSLAKYWYCYLNAMCMSHLNCSNNFYQESDTNMHSSKSIDSRTYWTETPHHPLKTPIMSQQAFLCSRFFSIQLFVTPSRWSTLLLITVFDKTLFIAWRAWPTMTDSPKITPENSRLSDYFRKTDPIVVFFSLTRSCSIGFCQNSILAGKKLQLVLWCVKNPLKLSQDMLLSWSPASLGKFDSSTRKPWTDTPRKSQERHVVNPQRRMIQAADKNAHYC